MENIYDLLLKRFFDVLLSFFLISAFSLPMLIISLMIKLSSAGNILYWSERVGRGQSLFWMPKFRTMHSDTPPLATHLLSDIDNRLTFFGKFLRKTSLDELPQLFSIFKGDMSFVGPRPLACHHYDRDLEQGNITRKVLRGGLLGLGHIHKGTAEMGSPEYEYEYIDSYIKKSSLGLLLLDLWIIWKGLIVVLKGKGL